MRVLFELLDVPFRALQRLLGIGRMPYIFLIPNLVFFGLFVVVPLFINFAFSVTGGTDLFLNERPYVGAEQYGYLATATAISDPSTCREDRFWARHLQHHDLRVLPGRVHGAVFAHNSAHPQP